MPGVGRRVEARVDVQQRVGRRVLHLGRLGQELGVAIGHQRLPAVGVKLELVEKFPE